MSLGWRPLADAGLPPFGRKANLTMRPRVVRTFPTLFHFPRDKGRYQSENAWERGTGDSTWGREGRVRKETAFTLLRSEKFLVVRFVALTLP